MSDGGIQNVGARLVLENAAAFQAQLKESTDALQTFNDEQQRAADLAKESSDAIIDASEAQADAVKESATVSADAVGAEVAATVKARDAHSRCQRRHCRVIGSYKGQGRRSIHGGKHHGCGCARGGQHEVLKWGSVIGAVVGYEA